ncbi:MAG: FHA domain-containing protein [Luteimonas sp.]
MEALKLRFANRSQPELSLGAGVHGIGRAHGGDGVLGLLDESQAPGIRFCVDRRGVWLTVADETRGVHVNGREVRRMAMLRVGDAIYVDGIEMRLVSAQTPAVPSAAIKDAAFDAVGDPRVVLRGVGGQYHGRSFTLERPRLVGRSGDADIRIDDPAFADRHARLELIGDDVVLRDLGSVDGSLVNGEPVRDALLQTGDQIVFDAHHRFVVEAPTRPKPRGDRSPEPADETTSTQMFETGRGPSARRLPWLLLAALIIAGLLAALFLFGSG